MQTQTESEQEVPKPVPVEKPAPVEKKTTSFGLEEEVVEIEPVKKEDSEQSVERD